jgi:hypothetical protein
MAAREDARRNGQARRKAARPELPTASMGDGTMANMESRKRLAETQKRDAGR